MALKTRTVAQSQTECVEVLWGLEDWEIEKKEKNLLAEKGYYLIIQLKQLYSLIIHINIIHNNDNKGNWDGCSSFN